MSEVKLAMAQAYIVIGALINEPETIDELEVMRALDYFSLGDYDEDFLPWG